MTCLKTSISLEDNFVFADFETIQSLRLFFFLFSSLCTVMLIKLWNFSEDARTSCLDHEAWGVIQWCDIGSKPIIHLYLYFYLYTFPWPSSIIINEHSL